MVEKKPKSKEKVIFTNGVFDVLHVGHIDLLKKCKKLGKVIVGINSDRATKLLKGEHRPINNEQDRKTMLEAIRYVDEVVIFDDIESIGIIMNLKPDVVVKGGEWTAEQVRQRDGIPDEIEVRVFPLSQEKSTTDMIKKIKEAEKWEKGGINK